jgi:benzoyl-CoA reductase/2-hydroxyglutaryl-CoA dehydratase subunit BcrC/BadD/HgdB
MSEKSSLSDAISQIQQQKEMGKKIYGIMAHGLVPEELIYAVGGFPFRLPLAGDKDSVDQGIEYLTPATCSFAKSTIGHFKMKHELYEQLDFLIGGNYCNGELCATELISDYFKIPRINIVFPSTKNQFAIKFMEAELVHFQEELERIEGSQISDAQLGDAIDLCNAERKLIQEIAKTQATQNYPLSGVECLDLIHKHLLFGVQASIENLQQTLSNLQDRNQSQQGKKIVFAGNGVPIGDNIIQLIESQQLSVIRNITWTGLDYYDALVEAKTVGGLAEYYIKAENTGRMILSQDYLDYLIKTYEACNAEGLILYKLKYCSIIPAILSAKLKEHLSEKGILYLEIERDYGVTTDAQLHTKIQAFQEMLA